MNDDMTQVEVKASIPAPDWKTLIVAIVSAAIGWLAKWLEIWNVP